MAIDVTEATFATEVLERSRTVPVVVDFWAAWCGPCRTLGPVIEAAVAARGDEVRLVKVDVDANPGLQVRYGIRGIPAVKAFRDGVIVAEFTGAAPRAEVERFLDRLLPSPAERLAAAGDEASLRAAVAADPDHPGARVGLARLRLERGDDAEAERLLLPVGHDPAASGLLARIALARADGASPASPALDALAAGDLARALDGLVAVVRSASGPDRDLARRVAVGVFAELGDADPVTAEFRPKLAAALY